jgi:hypothetical protein
VERGQDHLVLVLLALQLLSQEVLQQHRFLITQLQAVGEHLLLLTLLPLHFLYELRLLF